MREIKFRAWSNELQKMFEHADINGLTGQVFFAWNGVEKNLKNYAGTGTGDCIPMQLTGLKDKNGKEIYEGDILDVGDWCNGKSEAKPRAVEWGVLADSDGYHATNYACWKTGDSSLIDTAPLSAVIGNIHENHGILEGI